MKADELYAKVTADVIRHMEEGAGEWQMPWKGLKHAAISASSGKPYRGINFWILGIEQQDRGYRSHEWGTFKHWLGLGTDEAPVCVRKGEKGTHIFLWKESPPSAKQLARDPSIKKSVFATAFSVFNRDQVDGLPPIPPDPDIPQHERWAEAERYFETVGASVRDGNGRAFYASVRDFIGMPPLDTFYDRDHYYTTLAHEHVHWTGHKDRLNREFGTRFGDEAYAFEELVAEMGAAYWGAQMGLDLAIRRDHASYLSHWLNILRADNKAIVTAASRAQAAIDHLNTLADFKADRIAELV
jgi:antirestriction protein ArdC